MAWKWWGQSPSSLKTFDTCPYQFRGKYLAKEVKWVQNEHAARGDRFHKDAEGYIEKKKPMTDEFRHLSPVLDIIRGWQGPKLVEATYSVKDDLTTSCEWKERTVGSKIDLTNLASQEYVRLIDYKTGKIRPDPLQLDINVLCLFAALPNVQRIRGAYLYTTEGDIGSKRDYTRETDLPRIKHDIGNRIIKLKRAFAEDKFPKIKNGLCKNYCDVRSCEFNGRRGETIESE